MRNRENITALLLVLLSLAVVLGAPFLGMQVSDSGEFSWGIINPSVLFAADGDPQQRIFWMFRAPRVLFAFLAGAGLAVSGTCFQGMFHNPLATPFTLGISSGAAFGAALFVWFGFAFGIAGVSGITLFALAGALLAVLVVYSLTRVRKGFSTGTLLLAGVAVNFFFSSLILFVQYISNEANSVKILRWLMGSVEVVGMRDVLSVLPFIMIGASIAFWLTNELNLLLTGEDLAVSRGVSVNKVKHALFFGTSLMIGGIVAFCGPIGFVGMMCPHMCRAMIGPDHRRLLPVSFMFGGAFLVVCDTFARTLIAPAEIPVGVITAMLGGPFFLLLLMRRSREMGFV